MKICCGRYETRMCVSVQNEPWSFFYPIIYLFLELKHLSGFLGGICAHIRTKKNDDCEKNLYLLCWDSEHSNLTYKYTLCVLVSYSISFYFFIYLSIFHSLDYLIVFVVSLALFVFYRFLFGNLPSSFFFLSLTGQSLACLSIRGIWKYYFINSISFSKIPIRFILFE